ncbi:NUDIX hydrolase [Actinoplanes sp. NBRC 103695]|uniref:NUDIX domain-containing protein n=1 Tax=Actinoplanes sp. NBRC 103695 TaxID=3032202 RepID=UPI0024A44585|nr:NUDIX hydrolase [Actinoplanes sp. NBRC 103695]GLY97731.1 hypothetical protein Acsp02_49850 [Actinoplanes sp. NBRC 103695]
MVSSAEPLFERDPEAWHAHLAEGNATQARKRVSADALIRDRAGRVLLVDPRYKPGWDTPGGMAEANEPPDAAVRREIREELGLTIHVGPVLVVDWVSPHGPWDDLLAFVFDGGEIGAEQMLEVRFRDDEISAYEFCTPEQAGERLRPHIWRRLVAALEALESRRARYLRDGLAP